MTYIVNFTITGLAGRDRVVRQALHRQINAFHGVNGAGKTSLLRVLDSALGADPIALMNIPFETAEVEFYSHDADCAITRSITKSDLQEFIGHAWPEHEAVGPVEGRKILNRVRNVAGLDLWNTMPAAFANKDYRHRFLSTYRTYYQGLKSGSRYASAHDDDLMPGRAASIERSFEDAAGEYFERSIAHLWMRYSAKLDAHVRATQEQGIAKIFETVFSRATGSDDYTEGEDLKQAFRRLRRFLGRQKAQNLLGDFDNFSIRHREDPMLRRIATNVNDIEKRIESTEEPRRRLQAALRGMIPDKKISLEARGIHIGMADNAGTLPLGSLSSGEKQALTILLETIVSDRQCILIDEPELSLHVDWQQQLLSHMNKLNPTNQIIAATHSPEILSELSDDQVFRL